MTPLMTATSLSKQFVLGGGFLSAGKGSQRLTALDDVSLHIGKGEIVGVVGESGCGKSTLARVVARLSDPSGGRLEYQGHDLTSVPAARFQRHPLRRSIQMVFQDPSSALDRRWRALDAIAEPLVLLKRMTWRDARLEAARVARLVGLPAELLNCFPHQLSGGQKARVGIARAIAPGPELIVLDEPTSSLDVSVQSVVLQLLGELRQRLQLSYLFISHDLNLVRLLCDRVLVMYLGRVVESGPVAQIFETPKHPYTQLLLQSIPTIAGASGTSTDPGEPTSPFNLDPESCRFAARCSFRTEICTSAAPPRHSFDDGATVECHNVVAAP